LGPKIDNKTATRSNQYSDSAKTHAGTSIMTCDLHTLTPKMNGFPGLIVEHLYAKFGDPLCISFWDIVCKRTKTAVKTLPCNCLTAVTYTVVMGNMTWQKKQWTLGHLQ